MKSIEFKNKIKWGIIYFGLFGIVYWLCRFKFFEFHGMKQWPSLLAIIGVIIILIASFTGRRVISIATILGYLVGFVFGMIFNTDGIDPGGGKTNNGWLIWGCVFFISVVLGFFVDRRLKNKKE